jgi:hypothetical protein
VPVPLADLQGHEAHHPEADHLRVDLGAEALDRAAGDQFVQSRLHGAAGDGEATGEFQHADARFRAEQFDQSRVEPIELHRLHSHSGKVPY